MVKKWKSREKNGKKGRIAVVVSMATKSFFHDILSALLFTRLFINNMIKIFS